MEKINELTSENIVQQNIERLKEIFPTAFSEGKLVVNELQALVGEYIDKDKEFYQMTWAGKTQAQKEANKVSTGTKCPYLPHFQLCVDLLNCHFFKISLIFFVLPKCKPL